MVVTPTKYSAFGSLALYGNNCRVAQFIEFLYENQSASIYGCGISISPVISYASPSSGTSGTSNGLNEQRAHVLPKCYCHVLVQFVV